MVIAARVRRARELLPYTSRLLVSEASVQMAGPRVTRSIGGWNQLLREQGFDDFTFD
jgi:hypothetical protein